MTTNVIRDHRDQIQSLTPSARVEVAEFVRDMVVAQPTTSSESISVAVKAVINLERSRSGQALLQNLGELSDDDIEGLIRLLDNWTVRDALSVLDEIERRVSIIEALERLASDPKVDELRTLHPLVTQARWLFGAEFDSPLYASNTTTRTAVENVFKKRKAKRIS